MTVPPACPAGLPATGLSTVPSACREPPARWGQGALAPRLLTPCLSPDRAGLAHLGHWPSGAPVGFTGDNVADEY